MKVVITGGHISPAIAVIEALPKGSQVAFIGRKHAFEGDNSLSLEYQEIKQRNIPFYNLKTGRLQRTITPHTLFSMLRIPKGIINAYTILKKEKPECILSFGGYIGLPVVLAGYLLGIPSVIHEQTFHAGFSNKVASRFAKKICISWEQSKGIFPKEKTVLTGNPLRKSFLDISDSKPQEYEKPMMYVTGGSAGSHEINQLVDRFLDELLDDYTLVHQTGDTKQYDDYGMLLKRKNTLPKEKQKRYHLYHFTSEAEAKTFMVNASLVVSRSGINTVTELLSLQKKAYLIPLTHGQKGEQMTNAQFLKSVGLAEIYSGPQQFLKDIQTMISSDTYMLDDAFDMSHIKKASSHIVSVLSDVSQKP